MAVTTVYSGDDHDAAEGIARGLAAAGQRDLEEKIRIETERAIVALQENAPGAEQGVRGEISIQEGN